MQTKDEVLEKASCRCALCGWGGNPAIINIHHILPKAEGGPDYTTNQIVLCPNHHALVTQLMAGLISIEEVIALDKDKSTAVIHLAETGAVFRVCQTVNRFKDPALDELLVKAQSACEQRIKELKTQISS